MHAYPPATKCAHALATGAGLAVTEASLRPMSGSASPVSRDCVNGLVETAASVMAVLLLLPEADDGVKVIKRKGRLLGGPFPPWCLWYAGK